MLIKNATILTMNENRDVIYNGAIVTKGDRIAAVGNTEELTKKHSSEEVVDATGKFIIPGLINTHTHMFQALLKGLGDDKVLVDWFREMTGPSATKLTPDYCYAAARLSCLEAIRSGCTTVVDFMYVHPTPKLSDPIIQAMIESGIRGIFARGYTDYGEEEGVPFELISNHGEALDDSQRLFNKYNDKENGRIKVWIAPCMIWSQTIEGLKKTRELADSLKTKITMHIAETPYEVDNALSRFGMRELPFLAKIGFLGPDVLAVHCVHLTQQDIRILKHYDVKVSHNAISNMYLSSGVAPIPELLSANVSVGLATDGPASNNNQNMISTLKFTSLLHKINTEDPTSITAEKVFEMATIDGAKALGMEKDIGSLEAGKKADVVLLDLNKPFTEPVHYPVSSIVYSAIGNEVDSVIIDGNFVLKNKKTLLINEDVVLKEAIKASDALAKDADTYKLKTRAWRSTGF